MNPADPLNPVIQELIIDSIDVPNGTYICKNTWPNEARVTVPITYTPGQMAVEEAFYIKILEFCKYTPFPLTFFNFHLLHISLSHLPSLQHFPNKIVRYIESIEPARYLHNI